MIQCQVCNKDFNRRDFPNHECLKDMYIKKLQKVQFDVFDYLAENLMMLRRNKASLGLCMKQECVYKFKASGQYKAGNGMIITHQSNNP